MPKARYRKLTDRQIVCLFKYHHPRNVEEVHALGIKTRYFTKGVDRLCYRIGKKMVLKTEDVKSSSFDQTPHEIKTLKKVHGDKRYKSIRQHVVKLLYGNAENRMMLVPYHPIAIESGKYEAMEFVGGLIGELLPDVAEDLHDRNFRISEDGIITCIDLGYHGEDD